MAAGDDDGDATPTPRVQARFEALGGYTWRERANQYLHGLGFVDADLDRELKTFSGGQLTRASLARALAAEPDLLLLDEPTNHLDIESLEWLEETLTGLDAAIMLVAHDRWFLEAVGTAVLEMEAGRTRFFTGTWTAWRKEQAARELALGRAIEKQQAEIARMEAFVERFRAKATKARQAQDRMKKLAKIERIERDPRDNRELAFQFKKPERSGRIVFELEDGRIEVPGQRAARRRRAVARARRARLARRPQRRRQDDADRHARGPPAAGRAARSAPATTSSSATSASTPTSSSGAAARTVLEAAQKHTGLTPNQARALLGRFLFSGEEAEKPLDGLQRRRAPPAVAGDPRRERRQRPDPRRAHEPPRPRVARGARGRAAVVPRLAAARQPRPRAARRRRLAHGRDRGLHAALLRRRLARVLARARGAQGGGHRSRRHRPRRRTNGHAAATTRPEPESRRRSRRGRRRTRSASRPSWRRRSSRPRRSSRARGRARRSGGLGDEVRVGEVDGAPHGGQARRRGRLRRARRPRGAGVHGIDTGNPCIWGTSGP